MCFRKQFLRQMWPGQLAFLLLLYVGYSLSPWFYVVFLYFLHNRSKRSPPPFSSIAFQNFPGISGLICEVSKFQQHTKECSKCSTSLVAFSNIIPISCWKNLLLVECCFSTATLTEFTYTPRVICYQDSKTFEINLTHSILNHEVSKAAHISTPKVSIPERQRIWRI